MPDIIQLLSESVSNQIAAGEVIERPASVVRELLDNCVDADSDRILIEIEKGGKRLIKVRDNGIGMEPENIEDIFKMFVRLHPRTEYAGSGMGLSIVEKIVQHHGGRIWAESEPGEGSVFYFTLPSGEA